MSNSRIAEREKTKGKSRVILALLALLVGLSITTAFLLHKKNSIPLVQASSRQHVESQFEVRDTEWETGFFSALEERTKRINLPRLRGADLRIETIEFRFWYDARPDIINGFVIRRANDNWSAVGIRQQDNRWPSPVTQKSIGSPKSGWDAFWKRLTTAGILTLPDSDETTCSADVLDGGALVVETVAKQEYRTYRYSNPQFAKCDEAQRLLLIESIIADEFSLHRKN